MIVVILLLIFVYLLYRLTPKPPPNFPPGPRNYPLVGGLLSLINTEGDFSGDKLTNLGKRYGPITGFYLRSIQTILLNDYEVIKEVSNRDDFSFRPQLFIFTFFNNGRSLGVFNSHGPLWKEQRRFTLRTLRDFGFGKRSMEGLIHEEAEECILSIKKALKATTDNVIPMHDKFGTSVVNILLATVTGKRYSHDDKDFQRILAVNEEAFRNGNSTGTFINDYPWLRHIPILNSPLKTITKNFRAVKDLFKAEFDEHKRTQNPDSSRDFIDVYIKEMEKQERDQVKDSTFFEDQLLAICSDLFSAGAESTSNTVAFAILYMTLYPEIQEKVHKELDAVVGKDRLPSFDDKPKLHYLEAVMTELYRITPIAPISVPHANQDQVKLMGYDIPKDSFVLISIRSVHMDKSFWGDPEVFRPERFLNAAGEFVKPERVITFGLGKRACIGESLARNSAFSLFAAVMQTFRFEIPAQQQRPSTVPKDGFTLAPSPFQAKLILRQ